MMDQAGVRSDRPEGERSRYAYAPCQFRSEATELTPETVLNRFRPRPTMCRPSSRCRTLPKSVPATAWPCQGNSWSNDRYKSMNADQREAARDLFAEGEPGFSLSACEYLASRDIGPHHRRRDHGRSPSCVVLRGELANSRKMISPILRPTSALRKWMPPQTRALSTSSVSSENL